MKRFPHVVFVLGLGLVAGLAAPVLRAQTTALAPVTQSADELVARNLAAIGGVDKMKAVTTLKQSGHLTAATLSAPVAITLYSKRPNSSRQEVAFNNGALTLVIAFDGTTGWQVDPRTGSTKPVPLIGTNLESVRQQSNFDSPLIDYKAHGTRVEVVGPEMFDTRRVVQLRVTETSGLVTRLYLDDATGLEARVVTDTAVGVSEQQFDDYRTVNGIKVPFLVRTYRDGLLSVTIKFDTIELNTPMDDAMFKMPVR